MTEHQLSYRESVLAYKVFGNGPELVFCFHGYGESAAAFRFLEKYSGNRFLFVALDFPFHGETKWNEGLTFNKGDLKKIVCEIIGRHNPIPDSQFPVSLLGFSLGGRLALGLYQSMPEKIKKMVLLAPDGLKVNFWYWLATQTWLGNKLFSATMKNPAWFFAMLKLFNKLKLVNASIFKFVRFYIGDKEVRTLLYKRWTALRKIKPGLSEIKSLIIKHKTPAVLVYGKHDRIILPAAGEKFKKGIETYCRINIIESGHQVLHEKHVVDIMPALTSDS